MLARHGISNFFLSKCQADYLKVRPYLTAMPFFSTVKLSPSFISIALMIQGWIYKIILIENAFLCDNFNKGLYMLTNVIKL